MACTVILKGQIIPRKMKRRLIKKFWNSTCVGTKTRVHRVPPGPSSRTNNQKLRQIRPVC
uniref:Uncharacterized protein n=1 Tax=Anguilla anguilla TaxID=7936 RepID=A0A0E9PID8_ANGAN